MNFLLHLRDLQYKYENSLVFKPKEDKYRGMPNNEIFNRFNRYEMIFFIHALQKQWGLKSREECLKIERMIWLDMPPQIKTQVEVADWLVLNWNTVELLKSA
ncbi:hypothetical protein [Pedobacter sp. SYSU D00535]|uniref:hypothetical protein n=1 Tax=Pedobacter sp. SYSU D00535 TaxID=2810308 RepID=UPI001A959576|nr:hypothetical protein [Pedobacter sp. SYSU D00535]